MLHRQQSLRGSQIVKNVFVCEDRNGNRNEDEDEGDWSLHVSMALLWWDFGGL